MPGKPLPRSRFVAMLLLTSSLGTPGLGAEESPRPLMQAHAHNDYHHPRPLLDALDQGFCSVEADVFVVDGQLLVGHDRGELTPERTLTRLYLDPLRERVERNGGRVYPDGPPFTLLIDFKTSAEKTYPVLEELLEKYASILAHETDGQSQPGAVQVVISGDRPLMEVARATTRLAMIDGRLPDLDDATSAAWMPLISDRWGDHFRWRGDGPIPPDELDELQRIVKQTHSQGRRLRFWAIPDTPEAWRQLHAVGVDLINTDDLRGLAEFLRSTP